MVSSQPSSLAFAEIPALVPRYEWEAECLEDAALAERFEAALPPGCAGVTA